MARVAGVDLPDHLKLEYALQKIYGVGSSNVLTVLEKAALSPDMRANELNEEQVARIVKALDDFLIEGELRRKVNQDITRLKTIGSYRGSRHADSLPARGQRTKSNARTKRGKRQTVGAFKKSER